MKTTKEINLEVCIEISDDDESTFTAYRVYVGDGNGPLFGSTDHSVVHEAFHEALTEYLLQEKLKSL